MQKLESDWLEGVWIGHCDRSNEAILGTAEGVVRAWAIRRRPDGERLDTNVSRSKKSGGLCFFYKLFYNFFLVCSTSIALAKTESTLDSRSFRLFVTSKSTGIPVDS